MCFKDELYCDNTVIWQSPSWVYEAVSNEPGSYELGRDRQNVCSYMLFLNKLNEMRCNVFIIKAFFNYFFKSIMLFLTNFSCFPE